MMTQDQRGVVHGHFLLKDVKKSSKTGVCFQWMFGANNFKMLNQEVLDTHIQLKSFFYSRRISKITKLSAFTIVVQC